MNSVDDHVDARVAAIWRRDRRWGWYLLLIPVQAVVCLIAYTLGRVDLGTAVLLFFALWVPTLIFYFPVRSLIWKPLASLQAHHPQNVAIALATFLRDSKKDSDFRPSFPEFERMSPAFRAWGQESCPNLAPPVVDMLVLVADMFPTWIVIGPPADPEVYPLIYTALLRSGRDEAAVVLKERFAKHFKHAMTEVG